MNAYEQMRDRIAKILWCCQWMYDNTGDESVKSHLMEPIRIAKEALALPRRNCDVGTAEEQSERFMDFCRPGNRPPNCEKCKIYPKRMNKFWCQLEWAQTLYAAGEGAGK